LKFARGIVLAVFFSVALAAVESRAQGSASTEELAAERWFERMQNSLQTMNFNATFVSADPFGMQMYRWLQSVHGDSLSIEVLEQLEGAPQPIIRVNNRLSYFSAAGPSYSTPGSRIVGPWPEGIHESIERLRESYEILLAGGVRMLDSPTIHLRLIPHQTDRFSYSVYVERASGMLFGVKTYAPDGSLLSQVILSHFEHQDQPIEELERSVEDVDFPAYASPNGDIEQTSQWRVSELPRGFRLIREQRVNLRPMNTGADHMLFSDGMTQFSVYVNDDVQRPLPMRFQSLYSVVSLEQSNYSVTVVGKIPATLAESVAQSVVRVSDND